jgi:phage gp36-like protein
MGNYATTTLLEERITSARLTDLARGLTGTDKTNMLENAIERAEALIDGYAATKYTVPLTANALCEEWTLAICEYELYKRSVSGQVPEKIKETYLEVISQLKDIAKGLMSMPNAQSAATADGTSVSVDSDDVKFDDDNMDENYG